MVAKIWTGVKVVIGVALAALIGAAISAAVLGIMILMFFGGNLDPDAIIGISKLLFPLMLWSWGVGLPGALLIVVLVDGFESEPSKS